ncbi:MAG: class I SAM-dependent methyltransferase [Planctomycetes bacterium]|nr:class I SAM-dependent methyltransferase [Planctomycetota bacterium]
MPTVQTVLVQQEADRTARDYYVNRRHSASFCAQRRFVLRLVGSGRLRILDIGCGTGEMLPYLVERASVVVGCDLSVERLRLARASCDGARVVQADAMNLPFSARGFDVAIAMGVAEFVADIHGWMREIRRVLRPDGTVVVTFPHAHCAARKVGGVLRRSGQFVRRCQRDQRDRVRTAPQRVHRRTGEFDLDLYDCGFEKTFGAFCGVRLAFWPFEASSLLRRAAARLERCRWIAGRRALGSVYVIGARCRRD